MQSMALLIDSFRMMVARRLFWITLAINLLVVLSYGSIGSNKEGLSILFGAATLDIPVFANDSEMYRSLIQLIFSGFLVPIWLAWVATILALVSTTSVFPDFQQEGAIDIVLSKPISRAKVFLVKYAGSLLFVLLQVSIFCIGVFLVVGLRLQAWNWTILAGIPIVLIFYSYLYSFNALIGVATRSAIAALLFTMLFWFSLFIVQSAESTFNMLRTQQEVELEYLNRRISALELRLERTQNPQSIGQALTTSFNHPDRLQAQLESARQEAADLESTMRSFSRWHGLIRNTLTALPKTKETIGLLDRWIRADTEFTFNDMMQADMHEHAEPAPPPEDEVFASDGPETPDHEFDPQKQAEVHDKLLEDYDSRSPWLIIGTSLGFEAVMLGIACFIFVRRDY